MCEFCVLEGTSGNILYTKQVKIFLPDTPWFANGMVIFFVECHMHQVWPIIPSFLTITFLNKLHTGKLKKLSIKSLYQLFELWIRWSGY